MSTESNGVEAQKVVRLAQQFLESLDKFYGNLPFDQQERMWGMRGDNKPHSITYEKPDIVEMEYSPCGTSHPGEGYLMRLENDEMIVRSKGGSWVKMEECADFEDEDTEDTCAAYACMWRAVDPRRIFANIDHVMMERGALGEKIFKGIFNISAFNPPQGLIEYIVTGADDPLKPGNLNPEVVFELDSQNIPRRMTIGRILPDDESRQIEFSYETRSV